jgi:hypothetical protein
MTAAFNLAQLANNLNTSGQLDATDGLVGLVTNANLASSGTAGSSTYLRGDRTWSSLPALGKILQVVTVNKNDTFSLATQTWTDITGFSATITPSSASSKILILASVAIGASGDFAYVRLVRGATVIDVGNAASLRVQVTAALGCYPNSTPGYQLDQVPVTFVDSPATTSAVTYKFQMRSGASTATVYINRTAEDRDTANYEWRTPSNIILAEIGP